MLMSPLSLLSSNRAVMSAPASRSFDKPAPGEGPLLYSDEHLSAPRPARLEGHVPRIVSDLLGAADANERRSLLRGMLHAIGFEWLGYGTTRSLPGRAVPLSFFTSYAHPDWVHRYFSRRHYELDTRQRELPSSSVPLIWDAGDLAAAHAGPDPGGRHRRFLEDLGACGIRSGLMFRLASPTRSGEHTVISLMSGIGNRRWITEGLAGRALMLGLCVHDYLSRHTRTPAASLAPRSDMSATQLCILEHLRQGRSDKEIAYLLDLSSHAVDYHMRQLRRRFAVRNRVQLVNAAMQAQMLESGF
jgi:DNA-binding CsgD family transcriptional regulator